MRLFILFCLTISSRAQILSIDVPTPAFQIIDNNLSVESCAGINIPGAPDLPTKTVTICLPPGAIIEKVDFSGQRIEAGICEISPASTDLPLVADKKIFQKIQRAYLLQKDKVYTDDNLYPQDYGVVLSKGGLRKYTLLTVACYHFAYRPVSKRLYYSPVIHIEIQYRMPDPGSARARFWERLKNDVTYDDVAQEIIYNWQDAEAWYQTETPHRANGYYIIIPASLQSSVDTLVAYRQTQGYEVNVVTKEYIEANVTGVDLQQKIRNYLRQNLADIEYVLLVGFIDDLPWRDMVPFNNDPDSPYNDPNISPIPSDLYYAELTDEDSLSWNYDGDAYYGEVFDSLGHLNGDDSPDYHADVHLGRIPFSTDYVIEDICAKLIAFDSNTDISYKTAALLPAALYYYANENNGGNSRLDGATFTEELLDNGILDSTNAVTLYEKGGLRPSIYSCTDSLTETNHILYWQNKGIMYECHHGNYDRYARKVWAWDDGDSIPENNEMTWPTALQISDVSSLDNDHPATAFLRSCLCGKPETYGLGAYLLYRGASAVISSSRIAWLSSADRSGIPYHFYERLLQDTTVSRGIIGDAYDLARNDFMDLSSYWVIAYHYNLFGDPASRQFGRVTEIKEVNERVKTSPIKIFPNPGSGRLTISFAPLSKSRIKIELYDINGRFVQSIYNGVIEGESREFKIKLPAGIYFLKLTEKSKTTFEKVIIIK